MKGIVGPILASLMAIVVANCNESCKPVTSAIDDNHEYVEQTMACVAKAETRQESQECRAKVNWKFGLCPERKDVPC